MISLRVPRLLTCVLAGMLASGCATITTGSTQNLTVQSMPAGANCTLHRAGELLGVVTATPATLNISKGTKAINVTCQLENHVLSTQTLDADFQAMTVGNVLVGGLIGIAVDAASGAAGKYADQVNVMMVPNRFASETARDAHYDGLRQKLAMQAEQTRTWIRQDCQGSDCEKRQAAAERQAGELNELLSRQQQMAVIVPSAS